MQNEYGVLEKQVLLEVEEIEEENDEQEKALEMKRELHGIFRRQMKIYSALAR